MVDQSFEETELPKRGKQPSTYRRIVLRTKPQDEIFAVEPASHCVSIEGLTESCDADSEAAHSVFSRAKVACPT